MPGGALTANTQMLRDNKLMDRYPEFIAAMGEVVVKGGYGTSVTPVSQFYFQQAFNNVMFGPWKKIAEGYGKMVLGYFGKTPTHPDESIIKIASEQLQLPPTTRNPLDVNDENPAKGRKAAQSMLQANQLPCTDENIFIAASCLEKGITFLKGEGKIGVRKNMPSKAPVPAPAAASSSMTVVISGKEFHVELGSGGNATVNGHNIAYSIHSENGNKTGKNPLDAASLGSSSDKFHEVHTPIPGAVIRLLKKPGDKVISKDAIMILEAMKMESPIMAGHDGIIASFEVSAGEQVQTDSLVAVIKHS